MQVGEYEAAQRAKARALKAKFYPSNKRPLFKPKLAEEIPKFINLMPEWKKSETYFDAHILEWRRVVQEIEVSPIRAYIRRRAAQMGFTYDQIAKPNRSRKISHARFLIWWEIKNYVKPDASYPEIAIISGGFDHSSVIHGVKTVERWKREMLEGKR